VGKANICDNATRNDKRAKRKNEDVRDATQKIENKWQKI